MNIDELIKNTPLDTSVENSPLQPKEEPLKDRKQNIIETNDPFALEQGTQQKGMLPPISTTAPIKNDVADPTVWDKTKDYAGRIYRKAEDISTGITSAIQPQVEGAINLFTPKDSRVAKILEQRNIQRNADWEVASKRSPILSRVGYWGGLFASGAAVPGGVAGSIGKRIATGAASGALLGATQYTPNDTIGKTIGRAAIGGTIGGAIPGAIGLASSAKNAILPSASSGASQGASDVFKTAQAAGAVADNAGTISNPVTQAAERQGVNITPAQALNSKALASEVTSRRIPLKDKLAVENVIKEGESKLRGKVGEVIDSMVPEGRDAARAQANKIYATFADKKLNAASLGDVQRSIVYQEAAKEVSKIYPEIPVDTVKFQQQVAERMYDKASSLSRGPNPDLWQAKQIQQERRYLVNHLAEEVPGYKQAQHIWERVKLQESLVEKLGERKVLAGRSDLTPTQIMSTLAGSEEMKHELLTNIGRAGGNMQQAQDVLTLLEAQSRPSGLSSVISGASPDKINPASGLTQQAWDVLTSKLGGREARDKGFVELMTNPKWAKEVSKIKNISNAQQRFNKLGSVLGRAAVNAGVDVVANNGLVDSTSGMTSGNTQEASPVNMEDPSDLISQMPLDESQQQIAKQKEDTKPVEQYKPNSITAAVVKDSAAQKAIQDAVKGLPEKKQEEADAILNMDPDEFYKTALGTKEAQAKYLKQMENRGFDTGKIYKKIKDLEQIKKEMDDVKNTNTTIQTGSTGNVQKNKVVDKKRMGLGAGLLGLIFSLFTTILTGKPSGIFGIPKEQGGEDINNYAAKGMENGGLINKISNKSTKYSKQSEAFQRRLDNKEKSLEKKKQGILIDLMSKNLTTSPNEKSDNRLKNTQIRALSKKTEENGIVKIKVPM